MEPTIACLHCQARISKQDPRELEDLMKAYNESSEEGCPSRSPQDPENPKIDELRHEFVRIA